MKSFALKYAVVCLICIGSVFGAQVRFLAWDGNVAARDLSVMSGEKLFKIEDLHDSRKTAPIRVKVGENGIINLRVSDRKDAEGKPITLRLPPMAPGLTAPLVLLLPDKNTPSNLTGIIFEDDVKKFEFGAFRMLNVTGGPVKCVFGAENKILKAWKAEDFAPGGVTPTPIEFYLPADPKRAAYSSAWQPEPSTRNFVIVAKSVAGGRHGPLEVKVIPETQRDFEMQQSLNRGESKEDE